MFFSDVLPSCCSVVSAVACIGLLRRLSVMNRQFRMKLMCRQLWHLAVADLVFSLAAVGSSAVIFLVDGGYFSLPEQNRHMTMLCSVANGILFGSFFTSSFVETTLALSLLAALCRCSSALCVLYWGLFAAWPLGVLAGVYSIVTEDVHWSGSDCKLDERTEAMAGVVFLCLIVSVAVYILSCCQVFHVRRFGLSVQKKVWTRAHSFLLAWFLCVFPEVLRKSGVFSDVQWLKPYTWSLLNLNGLGNTIAYVRQGNYKSRLATRVRGRPLNVRCDDSSRSFSFVVSFGGVSTSYITADSGSCANSLSSAIAEPHETSVDSPLEPSFEFDGGPQNTLECTNEEELLGCFDWK